MKSDCCSGWPCHDWEELLKSDLSETVYIHMPDFIRSEKVNDRGIGRPHSGNGRAIVPTVIF